MHDNRAIGTACARMGRVALSIMLAVCLLIPPSYAHAGQAQLATQELATDLNAAWAASEGGLDGSFTITRGGSYYLSADMETGGNLVIDAADGDVALRLDGHVLTINGDGTAARKTMVQIAAARSVTFDGASEGGVSEIRSAGDLDVWGIASSARGCALGMNDLAVTLSSQSNDQRHLGTHAIRVDGGTLSMANCTVNMLMGNQSLRSASLLNSDENDVPSAVYATESTDSVVLEECVVRAEGTQALSLDDLGDTTAFGNAYALYSLAGQTTVRGGAYRATSLRGSATCLYGSKLEVERGASDAPIRLEANAAQIAAGILSDRQAGVTVDAPIEFSEGSCEGMAQCAAAFRSSAQSGFVLGSCAPEAAGPGYPALVMPGAVLEEANADGAYLASFSASADAVTREAVMRALSDALGDAGSCSVSSDVLGVKFAADASRAAASVTASSGTVSCPTVATALARLASEPGAVMKLLKNVESIDIADVTDAVIDLNGHAVSSLTFSSSGVGEGVIVKNGTIGPSATAVSHSAAAPLILSGVTIEAAATDANAYGIYAASGAGALSLQSSTRVNASATSISSTTSLEAYGVSMPSGGPELEISHSTVSAVALTPGVAAYGASGTTATTVEESTLSASGITGTASALYVGGTLEARNSTFKASTSDVATTASGVWMRTSSPLATDVTLDGCTVQVDSLVKPSELAGSNYVCVLGSTSESGVSAPSGTLMLKGACSFTSVSGTHLGRNLGDITLGSGFSLAASSDAPVTVSQAKRSGDIAFSLDSTLDAQSSALAARFAAEEGSAYEGWALASGADSAGAACLVWRSRNDSGSGVVEVQGAGAGVYTTFAAALAAAKSGDTVKLLADLTESGAQSISRDDLTIDLDGHALTLRAGDSGASRYNLFLGTALEYSGWGTLCVKNGTLAVEVGMASEAGAGATYRGLAVTGGGTLSVERTATIEVGYVGSTSPSASQQNVALQGVAVSEGTLSFAGALAVTTAPSSGALGALNGYGIYAQPSGGADVSIDVTADARVVVDGKTAPSVVRNTFYPETGSSLSNPRGLREITVDQQANPQFYEDLVRQFRVSATYDDPNDKDLRDNFGNYIYYVTNMVMDREGAWYDGLRIWAYSDEVTGDEVGKASSVVPAHVFVSTQYDTLPLACGIASSPSSAGVVDVKVAGSVEARCEQGHSYALKAAKATDADIAFSCEGATLSAEADKAVHLTAQADFDVRDFVRFSKTDQASRVAYSGTTTSKLVRFTSPVARGVAVEGGVSLKVDGACRFSLDGLDESAIEAPSFTVGGSFTTSGGTRCSVASPDGENEAGAVFAVPASGATLNPDLFEDAYGARTAAVDDSGRAVWGDAGVRMIVFKVGDAVVARYQNPAAVSLSEPSAYAGRPDDQRQSYVLAGWSLCPDENATGGYFSPSETLEPSGDATYYAVYETGLTTVPVAFTGMFDASGSPKNDVEIAATYGQTVGGALSAAGASVPKPADYTQGGYTYRFVGWYPYSSTIPVAPLVYSSDQLAQFEVTLAANGLSAANRLELRATYLPVASAQHLVTFVVDGRSSTCVVDDGAWPLYTAANNTNTNYVVPSKLESETGNTFLFDSWFSDSDGDGSLGAGEQRYPDLLPQATADATYVANWLSNWSDVTYTFYVKYYDEQTGKLYDNGVRVIDTTYERDVQEIADSVAQIGSKVGYGGKVHTMVGWSTRKSDSEPIYDAGHPLPSVGGSDRGMTGSSYAKTYYAVYSTSDHEVEVTFYDGDDVVGSASVSSLVTIDRAFAATGGATPSDKSEAERFLGWSLDPDGEKAVNSVSATIEELVGPTGDALSLHALYGAAITYTVRLRTADGSKVLYKVSVRSGSTIADALSAQGVETSVPAVRGRYFAGWATAAGELFDLETPVTGSADLYATYKKIRVKSDSADVSGIATSTSQDFVGAESVAVTLKERESADRPLHTATAENSYTILESYDLRMVATDRDGSERVVSGDVGAIALSIGVDQRYRNAPLRVFWLGANDAGGEEVKFSSSKELDSQGKIAVSIGDYSVGDADEGGNLSVAYIEGGASGGTLDNSGLGSGTLGSGTLGGGGALLSSGSGSLSGASLGSSLGGSLVSSSAGLADSGSASVSANVQGLDIGEGAPSDGEVAVAEETLADDEPLSGSWDSDGVVLVSLAAVAVAAIVYGLWRLIVVRPRREEADAEMPAMLDQYAGGLRF